MIPWSSVVEKNVQLVCMSRGIPESWKVRKMKRRRLNAQRERERERDFTSHICETPMTPLQFEKEQISVACTIVSSRGRNVRNG